MSLELLLPPAAIQNSKEMDLCTRIYGLRHFGIAVATGGNSKFEKMDPTNNESM